MAVAFDAVGPGTTGAKGSSSPLTWTHNATAGAAVLVGVTLDNASSSWTCTATYGGTTMTLLKAEPVNNGSSGYTYLFGLANVSGGSSTVSASFTGGTTDVISGGSMSFTGADTSSPFGTPVVASGTGTATLTATIASGSMFAGHLATGNSAAGTITAGTNQYAVSTASGGWCGSCNGATNTTGSLSWTNGTSTYGAIGVEVLAGSGGGGTPPSSGTVGPQYVGTGGSTAVSGTWSTLSSAEGSTASSYTTWTHSARKDSGTWQGAGFDFSSVPAGAVISDVFVEVQHKESSTTNITPVTGQLYVSGTAVGSAQTFTESTSNRIDSWHVTSGIAQSDLANLQVRVTANGASNTTSATESIDFARVTVTWSMPTVTGSGDVGVKKATASGIGTYVESPTGSGAVSLKKPAVAGTGTEEFAGSGSVTLIKPLASGSGTFTFTGSGGVTAKKSAPAGTGSTALPGLNGLGGVSLKKPAVSGSGSETFTGSGAAIGRKPSVTGAGAVSGAPVTGSGGITRRKPTVAGNGSLGFTGAGGVTRLKALLSGSGTVAVPVTGSGSAQAKKPLVSGTGSYSTTRPPLALGGSAQTVTYGGTVTKIDPALAGTGLVAAFGGSKTQVSFGGTLTHVTATYAGVLAPTTFGGSLSLISFGGSLIGWSMQTQDITLMEHNDETLDVTITKNGSALNLTGYTIEAYLKATAAAADADATTEKLSTTTGEITIVNAATGQAEIAIPAVDLADTTHTFWRLDVVNAGKRNTVFSGKVTVTPL